MSFLNFFGDFLNFFFLLFNETPELNKNFTNFLCFSNPRLLFLLKHRLNFFFFEFFNTSRKLENVESFNDLENNLSMKQVSIMHLNFFSSWQAIFEHPKKTNENNEITHLHYQIPGRFSQHLHYPIKNWSKLHSWTIEGTQKVPNNKNGPIFGYTFQKLHRQTCHLLDGYQSYSKNVLNCGYHNWT